MCFNSKSKSESKVVNTTEQIDERVAATDDAIVVQLEDGSMISIDATDGAAFDLAEVGLTTFEKSFERAVDFADRRAADSKELLSQILDQDRPEDSQNFGALVKWGTVIALGAVAFQAFKGK